MISASDREIIRTLAGRVGEIAADPSMPERKKRWYALNSLKSERPLVLCFPERAWAELLPENTLQCQDKQLRDWERGLRRTIYWWEHIRDDNAIDPFFNISWWIKSGDFGVAVPYTHGENRGSYTWDPPLKNLDRDLEKIHFREFSVEREGTARDVELARQLFGDLLPPRIRQGNFWLPLTWEVIKLIGLENLMLFPYDQPEGLHRLMAFLRDDYLRYITWLEDEGLLTLANEADYVGSGGVAYTGELPQKDWRPGGPVRLCDRWGFSESQETVSCSPQMFAEYVLPYQLPLLEKFGLNAYGCCEAVHQRIDLLLKQVPRLRRVSVAPWADEAVMGEKLAGKCVYSRKPNPALVCVEFDEAAVRADLRKTLRHAGGLALEIILKDTHTVQHDPRRISRWVQIALEEVQECAAGKKR